MTFFVVRFSKMLFFWYMRVKKLFCIVVSRKCNLWYWGSRKSPRESQYLYIWIIVETELYGCLENAISHNFIVPPPP
jgi:hypothetical protein